jgi:hypothetical protein
LRVKKVVPSLERTPTTRLPFCRGGGGGLVVRCEDDEDKTRAAFLMVTVEKREDGRDIPRRKKKWATTFRVLVFRVSKVWSLGGSRLDQKKALCFLSKRRDRIFKPLSEREREREREKI